MPMTKDIIPTKLLWIDLEMTGLDPTKDLILEVAVEVTDFDFKTLASYEARIKHSRENVASRMQKNTWWKDFPGNRDEFLDKLEQGKSASEVEQELIALVEQNFNNETPVLAGNSIHNDRAFIKKYWPTFDLRLHYRMLDVSAWKVLMQGKYGVIYEKKEVHRAFDDIQASIAELQHYLDWFKENR
ncbi:MAG TPA: oligoribonuclease [Candidatus Saccharimonadales bacterium]|nr:oligoribonuclease [Candidatus Saccharimonadales bacterium]